MAEKKKHTLLKVIGATAVAGASAYGGLSYYVFKSAFDIQHSTFLKKKRNTTIASQEKKEWLAHSERKDDFIHSYDGLKLHALRIENHPDSHDWVVIHHGAALYSGDMIDLMYEADHEGFNVLALDARAHGMSEGKYSGIGWNEHYDLISWIQYLTSIDSACRIAVIGEDLGASALLHAVGDYLPENVKCGIEVGGYNDMKKMIVHAAKKAYKVNASGLLPCVDVFVKQKLHFSMKDVSMKRQLKEASIPMLFVHGAADDVVPVSMVFDVFDAYPAEKELLIAENCGFQQCEANPHFYKTAFAFIRKHLN